MTDKHMKKYSISFLLKKFQIKTPERHNMFHQNAQNPGYAYPMNQQFKSRCISRTSKCIYSPRDSFKNVLSRFIYKSRIVNGENSNTHQEKNG